MPAEVRIGVSGWRYPPWRGAFYPKGLRQTEELHYLANHLNSVEINTTFYALQTAARFAQWRDDTPSDFRFTIKGGRFITHMKKLANIDTALANFFAAGVLALGPKLGPFLWQLPPNLRFDADRISGFLDQLPRSGRQAVELARHHDGVVSEQDTWFATDGVEPLRHAVEVRHESFKSAQFTELLREGNVALVVADAAGRWPVLRENTADFRYARLHGEAELYTSGYTGRALDKWADEIRGWCEAGQDCFVYFDNDVKAYAPRDARALLERIRR
jgi:uncharacterized protein YecE (DUF72 family)